MSWIKLITWIGRLVFLTIYVIQASFLAKYLANLYEAKVAAVALSLVPALMVWLVLEIRSVSTGERPITHLWIVWLFYTLGLVASVATIFVQEVEKLDTSMEFGPNRLKVTLCLAPCLHLLLLNTTVSATKNPKLIERLSMSIALDLFDGIEMLQVLLMQGHELTPVSEAMKYTMLISVCLSFLMSSMTLYQHKFDLMRGEVKSRRRVSLFRAFVQITLVDFIFLVLRSILWVDKRFSASIFITKNVISIVSCITEVVVIIDEQDTTASEPLIVD